MFVSVDSALLKKRASNLKTSLPLQKYAIQNGVELNLKHCFALSSSSAQTPIQVLFDDQLLFVVGNYIVLHNTSLSSQQTYIELEPGFASVTYIASASMPEKKAILAYCDGVAELSAEGYAGLAHKRFFNFPALAKKLKKTATSTTGPGTGTAIGTGTGMGSLRGQEPGEGLKKTAGEGTRPESKLYRGRVAVVGVNLKEKHVLTHVSSERFEIRQIELSEQKYCFVLCESEEGEQVLHIWDFSKEVLLLSVEIKQRARLFALNPVKKGRVSLESNLM
jgi:hypothetical protein